MLFTNRIPLVVPSFTPVYLSLKLGISYSKFTSAQLVHYRGTSPTEPEAACQCEHAGEWQRESCPRIRQVLIPPVCRLFFCLLTRCRLLRHSEPRSRWCAEATRSSRGSVESSPSQHYLHGGVTVESKASVVVPPRLDTVDICTHTPEGCEVLGSGRRPCLTNTGGASRRRLGPV